TGGLELHLTSLEQNLLYLLAANAGRMLTRDEILDYLWGSDYAAESNVVDRHIRNLRAKLQNDWKRPRYIETVPGRGYRFTPTSCGSDGMLKSSLVASSLGSDASGHTEAEQAAKLHTSIVSETNRVRCFRRQKRKRPEGGVPA